MQTGVQSDAEKDRSDDLEGRLIYSNAENGADTKILI